MFNWIKDLFIKNNCEESLYSPYNIITDDNDGYRRKISERLFNGLFEKNLLLDDRVNNIKVYSFYLINHISTNLIEDMSQLKMVFMDDILNTTSHQYVGVTYEDINHQIEYDDLNKVDISDSKILKIDYVKYEITYSY